MIKDIMETRLCSLRPVAECDAERILEILKDRSASEYFEGTSSHATSIETVKQFIASCNECSAKKIVVLRAIEYLHNLAGIVLVRSSNGEIATNIAILPAYQNLGIGQETIDTIVSAIEEVNNTASYGRNLSNSQCIVNQPNILFLCGRYFSEVAVLVNFIADIDFASHSNAGILTDLMTIFRDASLHDWLEDQYHRGNGSAYDLLTKLLGIPQDAEDRYLTTELLKLFGNSSNLNFASQIEKQVRLQGEGQIEADNQLFDIANIFQPIELPKVYDSFKIKVGLDVISPSKDKVHIRLGSQEKTVDMSSRTSGTQLEFIVYPSDRLEFSEDIYLDGNSFITLSFKLFPPKEWNDDECTRQGIKFLYHQNYEKAILCFKKYRIPATLFWSGILKYINGTNINDIKEVYQLWQECWQTQDSTYAHIARCMMALLELKGEVGKPNLERASSLIRAVNVNDTGSNVVRLAIHGSLSPDEFESLIYGYSVSDINVPPVASFSLYESLTMSDVLFDFHEGLRVTLLDVDSPLLVNIDSDKDSLYAHIGVTINNDWSYAKDDWNINDDSHRLSYDATSDEWKLHMPDFLSRYGIVDYRQIKQVNLIFRDGNSQLKIEPSPNKHFIIDCLLSRPHIALHCITFLLGQFGKIEDILKQSGVYLCRCKLHPY